MPYDTQAPIVMLSVILENAKVQTFYRVVIFHKIKHLQHFQKRFHDSIDA